MKASIRAKLNAISGAALPASEWKEVAKGPVPVESREPDDLAEDIDPRSISIRDRSAVLQWVMENVAWPEYSRRILIALWFEKGNVALTAETLGVSIRAVEKIWMRSCAEVRWAARMREHEKLRRCPNNMWKRLPTAKLPNSRVWFYQVSDIADWWLWQARSSSPQ